MAKIEKVLQELENRGYEAEIKTVQKLNGPMQGIMLIKSGEPANGPILCIEDDCPVSVQELADEVISLYEKYDNKYDEIENAITAEYVLGNCRPAVCRRDWNEEMLSDLVHRPVEGTDLELYVKCDIADGAFKVTKGTAESLGISEEELLDTAMENEEFEVINLVSVMMELDPYAPDLPDLGVYVIRNLRGYDGASGICSPDVLNKALEIAGGEAILIIPSSIHECLVMPENEINPLALAGIIEDVNEECVDGMEVLSNHPYRYDGESLENAGKITFDLDDFDFGGLL